MPRIIKSVPHQADRILSAWEQFRPKKTYSAFSLEQFRAAIQPCLAVRKRIEDLQFELRVAMTQRTTLDSTARHVMRRVVNAVRADPEDGENCAMYAAMGFVPRGALKKLAARGRSRARKLRARESAGRRKETA